LCDDLRDEGGKAKAALAASNLSLKSFLASGVSEGGKAKAALAASNLSLKSFLASGVSLVTHFCALPSLSARASYSFQRLSAI
jgi:hypothetical protein